MVPTNFVGGCVGSAFRQLPRQVGEGVGGISKQSVEPAQKIGNAVRALKQKWGTSRMKNHLWDQEYASGRWDHCEHSPGARVYQYIEKYAKGGRILDLGCGSGNTANELNASAYEHYTGIDISAVAVAKAAERSGREGRAGKNDFATGDIATWMPESKYDVILFRESIYYIPISRIERVLDHYSGYLTDRGVIIVNVGGSATRKARTGRT